MDLLSAALIITLILVIYQDLKKRAIHISLPFIIFALAIWINTRIQVLELKDIALNVMFILVNIIGLVIYTSIKSKKIVNPINSSIGIGDIFFFIAITPLFKLKSFILFFIIGLVFSLIIYLVHSAFKKIETIPLAGYLSLFLIINLLAKYTVNTSLLS